MEFKSVCVNTCEFDTKDSEEQKEESCECLSLLKGKNRGLRGKKESCYSLVTMCCHCCHDTAQYCHFQNKVVRSRDVQGCPLRCLKKIFCYYCLIVKSGLTLCNPMDYSPPGSSVPWISQARILEWLVIFFSRGSCSSRDQTGVSCIGKQIFFFNHQTTSYQNFNFYLVFNLEKTEIH